MTRERGGEGASAWVTEQRSLFRIDLETSERVFSSRTDRSTTVATDTLRRAVWRLDDRGELSRRASATGPEELNLRLSPSSGATTVAVEANEGEGGAWTLWRGALTRLSENGDVLGRVRSSALAIRHDPVRHVLWTTDRRTVTGYDAGLNVVHSYDLSGLRPRGGVAIDVNPANGEVFVQWRRSMLRLDAAGELIGRYRTGNEKHLTATVDGTLLTSRDQHVMRYAPDGTVRKRYLLPDRERVVGIRAERESGRVWVLTPTRLYTIDDTDALARVYPAPSAPESRRGRRANRFDSLAVMGAMPASPAIELLGPGEGDLVPSPVTISFVVTDRWSPVTPADVAILVDGAVVPASCRVDGARASTARSSSIRTGSSRASPPATPTRLNARA